MNPELRDKKWYNEKIFDQFEDYFNKDKTLVRESIENPCMDFQKSMDINMDIHEFWMTRLQLSISVDIHIDNQERISMQGHSAMDIRKQ